MSADKEASGRAETDGLEGQVESSPIAKRMRLLNLLRGGHRNSERASRYVGAASLTGSVLLTGVISGEVVHGHNSASSMAVAIAFDGLITYTGIFSVLNCLRHGRQADVIDAHLMELETQEIIERQAAQGPNSAEL